MQQLALISAMQLIFATHNYHEVRVPFAHTIMISPAHVCTMHMRTSLVMIHEPLYCNDG